MKEEIVWAGDAWIPVSVVPLTLMEMGVVRRVTRTSQKWAVYDLLACTFVTMLDDEPERTPVALGGGQVKPKLKVVDPAKKLDQITAQFLKVSSDDAKAKYRGQMKVLGVPDWHTAATSTPIPFPYPVHLAITRQKGGTERIVAVDALRSRVGEDLGHEMSKLIAWVRESLSV